MRRSFAIFEGPSVWVQALEWLNITLSFLVKTARVIFPALATNNERLKLADMSGDDEMSVTNSTE